MKPIVILSNAGAQCATFFWERIPDYYVGYRFIEHDPEAFQRPLNGIESLPRPSSRKMPDCGRAPLPIERGNPWGKNWMVSYEESDTNDRIQLVFRSFSDGSACSSGLDNDGAQEREFVFKPVENGVMTWMKLTTHKPIDGAICVQQCLRYSGATNIEWRQPIAHVPFLSEFDIQAQIDPNQCITYARRNNRWLQFPVQQAKYHTPPGQPWLGEDTFGTVDHGLIVRESLDKRYTSGMYWERTAYVSNRHHADCLHSSVDFGPLEAGQSRTVFGRFYFIEGTKEQLLKAFKQDFQSVSKAR